MTDYDYLFKIITIGNKYIGKRSYVTCLTENILLEDYVPTINVDYVRKYYYQKKIILIIIESEKSCN